ncbi:NIPSNAP family protein [Chitinibacter sp. SCUT-21]|uniref:NIPSNAP family protein n=1 Tax=Chitinibacter sp. SCUT-21 TaxID=2970891 RepID=UPI0035A654C4
MEILLEIRTYQLKAGTGQMFHHLVAAQSVPLLRQWGIRVIAFGSSQYDADTYVLIRAFRDMDDLNQSQETFYASDAWRLGPREAIVGLIESSTNVVLSAPANTIQAINE